MQFVRKAVRQIAVGHEMKHRDFHGRLLGILFSGGRRWPRG
jgi:hypothetical protein